MNIHMICKVAHEELLVRRGIVQFSLLPALIAGHEERVPTLGIIQLIVKVRELAHSVSITVGTTELVTEVNSGQFPPAITSSWGRFPACPALWCGARPTRGQ